MSIQAVILACLLWLVSFVVHACNYVDDPRLSSEQQAALFKALINGETVSPIRIRIGTYLQLGERSRKLLEPHLEVVDINCSPVGGVDGELLGRAVISFEEFYKVIAQAIKDDRPDIAKQMFTQVRVAPMTVTEVQRMFGQLPYAGSHGVKTRERMQEIFPQFARVLPLDKELIDPLLDGRPQDYSMFKLFQVFGGTLLFDQGCGPYELDKAFYRTEKYKSLFGGEGEALIVRREPFLHMMRAMGYKVAKDDTISYRIVTFNCN